MLGALAIVGFVVVPGLLALDLLAPGRHLPGERSRLRLALGGTAALGIGLGIGAALGRALGPLSSGPEAMAGILIGVVTALLSRVVGEPLDCVACRRGLRLVTPATWLDDRVGVLATRSTFGSLVLFGALHVPVAAGLLALAVLIAGPVRAVATAVATPVLFQEPEQQEEPEPARQAGPDRLAA